MARIQVMLQAADPISRAGAAKFLHSSKALEVVGEERRSEAQVVVLVTDTVTAAGLDWLRRLRAEDDGPLELRAVIVTDEFDAALTMTAVQNGTMSVISREKISSELLEFAVVGAAEGSAYLAPRLQRALLEQLDTLRRRVLEPNGIAFSGLAPRERDVLRLLAEGVLTDEIAARLAYSEATVKNMLYRILNRLGLRNRAHAVAYAIRSGAV